MKAQRLQRFKIMNIAASFIPTPKTARRWLATVLALAAITLTAGCGGGGGKAPALSAQPAGSALGKGEATFKVVFPAKTASRAASGFGRQAGALPPETQKVTVEIYAVTAGQREEDLVDSKTVDRPSEEGGAVSVKFILTEGRYIVVIKSLDAQGKVLAASTEPVSVKAGVSTSVPTTLGIMYTENGFVPAAITLKTGDRLVMHHDGTATGDFRLSSIADCNAQIERTGALACTLRQQGVYTLRSPNSQHTAEITVQMDETLLATGKPSLGVRRSEAIAENGSAPITFYFNNGGQAMPTGTKFNPGDGTAPVAITSETSKIVTYTAGGYVAQLVDSGGEVIAQKYVAIYAPQAPAPTAKVVFSDLPQQVAKSTLVMAGTTSPVMTGSVVLIKVGEDKVFAKTDNAGAFTASVQLKLGANTITALLLNSDGVEGPPTQATVTFALSGEPGQLAFIDIEGLGDILTAGNQVSFTATGYDSLGLSVSFTPTLTAEGFDIEQKGPTSFTPVTTGTGLLIVSGPGGVSASAQVTVEGGAVVQIVISPGNATLYSTDGIQFTVFGTDAMGNVVSRVTGVTFSGTGVLGGVDNTGSLLTVPAGTGVLTATAAGGLTAKACVSVNTAPAAQTASR